MILKLEEKIIEIIKKKDIVTNIKIKDEKTGNHIMFEESQITTNPCFVIDELLTQCEELRNSYVDIKRMLNSKNRY